MQGMIDLVRKGYFLKGWKVLYAHLDGAPALNGYSYTSAKAKAAMALMRRVQGGLIHAE